MTSNYLTASRARHVTFQSVSYWAMERSIFSLHYILLILVAHTRLETIAILVFLAISYISEYLVIFLYAHRFMAGWVSNFSPLSAARVVKH